MPVVARDLPVLREIFRDTVRYAVDPPGVAAHLEAVLRSRPDPVAGQRLAATNTWDAAAAAHLAFYDRLLGDTRSDVTPAT